MARVHTLGGTPRRLSRHSSVGGQSKRAKVAVRAVTDHGTIRAKCKLELKRDPQFGDFARARCKAAQAAVSRASGSSRAR